MFMAPTVPGLTSGPRPFLSDFLPYPGSDSAVT